MLQSMQQSNERLVLRAVHGRPRLVLYTDAAFDRKLGEARLGYVIVVAGDGWSIEANDQSNWVSWGSKRFRQEVISSTSAETYAGLLGIRKLWGPLRLMKELWDDEGVDRPIVVIDSQPLYSEIHLDFARCCSHLLFDFFN